MDILRSPTGFRQILTDKLLELLWRQWRTLGVASHGPETNLLIDLEALILATIAAGNHDQRLLKSAKEWLHGFREWVNLARIKRMAVSFYQSDPFLKQPLVKKQALEETMEILDPVFKRRKGKKGRVNEERMPLRVTMPPLLKKRPLLQLYLRSIFGVNARAEILLYLFLEGGGNSNQIARAFHFDQKGVYRILERWTDAGFVNKESGKKQNLYSLERGKDLFKDVQITQNFWRWSQLFLLYLRIVIATHTDPWEKDAYLLSSLFRDAYPDAANIARPIGMTLPDPDFYTGEKYFSPMALALEKLLDWFLN